jgi:hypothetical protein
VTNSLEKKCGKKTVLIMNIFKNIMVLVLLALSANSYSQNEDTCWKVKNTITTDWREAQSQNKWNWTLPNRVHPVYTEDNQSKETFLAELPYFCTKPPGSGSCDNPNTHFYELVGGPEYQDIWPEDGWELLFKDFGKANDNGAKFPFFMLYNKFTGKLKTYIMVIGETNPVNSAVITYYFHNGSAKRGIYGYAKPVTQALYDFETGNTFKSINSINVANSKTSYQWMVSEIVLDYDPCACMFYSKGKSTIISVKLQTIHETSIDASIEGTIKSSEQRMSNGAIDGGQNKTSFFEMVEGVATSGYESYNKWDSYKNKLNNYYNGMNVAYKTKLSDEWFKNNVLDPYAGDYTTEQKNDLFKEFRSSSDGFKKMVGVKGIDKYNRYGNLVKGVASNLPYVGVALGVVDFFVKGAKKNENTGNASPPANFDVRLKFHGKITGAYDKTSKVLKSPGSRVYGTLTDNLLPYYDNIPGVFNILELPEFEYASLKPNIKILNQKVCGPEEFNSLQWMGLKEYKPKSNIKYVLNPNSDLIVESIEAAVVLEYKGSQALNVVNMTQLSQLISFPYYDLMYKNDLNLEQRVKSIENSNNLVLDYVSSNYPFDTTGMIRFRTEYFPITCWSNMNFILLGSNNLGKSYIKVLLKLKRKDDENAESVTMVITYDLNNKLKEASEIKPNSGVVQMELKPYSWVNNVWVSGCNFNWNNFYLDGFKLTKIPFGGNQYFPNEYTYQGENDLVIQNRLTIPNNSVIPNGSVLKAGIEINIGKNVTIGDNSVLMAGKTIKVGVPSKYNSTVKLLTRPLNQVLYNCTDGNYNKLHNTDQEIRTFCRSSRYIESAFLSEILKEEQLNPKSTSNIQKVSFSVFPNPNNGSFSILLDEEIGEFTIEMTDVTGRLVYTKYCEGNNIKNCIQMNGISNGVYILTLRSNNYQGSSKVIVQSN